MSKKTLESHAVRALANVCQAHLRVSDGPPGVDREVVLDQLEDAEMHLAYALWTMHPEWDDLPDTARASAAMTVLRRCRPPDPDASAPPLVAAAVDHVRRSIAIAWPRRRTYLFSEAGADLDAALDHLERAVHVLDPDAPVTEAVERDVEAHRDSVRHRLGAALN